MDEEAIYPRFASRGRTFVYVLPCRHEDILKVGFSRDPLDRFRTLHRRFFEFFDLERGLLIHTDHLRDARRIERLFITTFADQRAPAPLVVPRSAAGHTEWFRGVSPQVDVLARQICEEQGFAAACTAELMGARALRRLERTLVRLVDAHAGDDRVRTFQCASA